MDQQESLAKDFRAELSKHGFPYQSAVFEEASRLSVSGDSQWRPEAPEFPVEVQGTPAHIDFLLRSDLGNQLLVVECKRVNPAYGWWCFARSKRTVGAWGNSVWGERMTYEKHIQLHGLGAQLQFREGRHYTTGLELKTKSRGDAEPLRRSSNGAITQAVDQAVRGLNGLVNFYGSRRENLEATGTTYLLPMVVTTASLFTTETEIEDASLESGILEEQITLERAPWLYYQCLQSPGLQHDYAPGNHPNAEVRRQFGNPGSPNPSTQLRQIGQMEFLRTVVIVSSSGLANFLTG